MIERLPDAARSRAVLIGTSKYTDPKFGALPGVANNLTDLACVLTSPDGTGLNREHCVTLLDPPAQAGVGDHIVRAAREAEDVLLVYYAGHGEMTWDGTNELCLTMRDTMSASLRTSALRCADLRQYIRTSTARTTVLILDCCFAGHALNETMSGTDQVLSEVDVAGAYVLAATYDRAQAPATMRNTLFTGELLRLLGEGIATEQRVLLTLGSLYRELKSTMHREGRPVPCSNNNDTADSLALAPNPAHKVYRRLADLRARARELVDAEHRTKQAYDLTIDRIASPNLPPWAPSASALLDRLTTLDGRAPKGHPPTAAELDDVDAELIEAGDAAVRLRELAAGPLEWRNDLRRLLESYQAMTVRLEGAERAELVGLHAVARNLLWSKPCDLGAATVAVNAYQRAVIEWREKR